MNTNVNPISWYDCNAAERTQRYESLGGAAVHAWLADLLPVGRGVIFDVGAGSGRDAAWLAGLGHDVAAVEPSDQMRAEGAKFHPAARFRWVADSLPDLHVASRLGLVADFILLSAIWMHIPTDNRSRAFRVLVSMIRPGGVIALSLRHGPADQSRGMHPTSVEEIERLAADEGLSVVRILDAADQFGRGDVSWSYIAVKLPV